MADCPQANTTDIRTGQKNAGKFGKLRKALKSPGRFKRRWTAANQKAKAGEGKSAFSGFTLKEQRSRLSDFISTEKQVLHFCLLIFAFSLSAFTPLRFFLTSSDFFRLSRTSPDFPGCFVYCFLIRRFALKPVSSIRAPPLPCMA
jgi:hypothetical protein